MKPRTWQESSAWKCLQELDLSRRSVAMPCIWHGPLARYVKLRVAHAPGTPGTFSSLPRVSDPNMHHITCVKQEPWCMPGSLTSGFLWSGRRGKCSRLSRRMRNQHVHAQFYVSDKRPIGETLCGVQWETIMIGKSLPVLPKNGEQIGEVNIKSQMIFFNEMLLKTICLRQIYSLGRQLHCKSP